MNKFTQLYTQLLVEFSEPIIQKLITKFSEVDEQTVRLYLDEFEKYKTELEKKDPFQYANFEELEQAVDKVKGDKPRDRSNIKIDVQKDDIVAEDDNVVIYRGDSQDKCILYGQGYTFCISRRGSGNMYSSYRGGKESTFYFIFFKKKPKEDNDHIMVLDHTRNGYEWTFANNNTQKVNGGWDEIVSKYRELAPFKDVLVNKKLDNVEKKEMKTINDFINNPSVKEFTKMDFNMRSRVLKMSINLSDDMFKILSKDLINEFLSTGPNLTQFQISSLNDKQKDWYLRNRNIHLDELADSIDYKFNELDLKLDKFEKYHTRDYNEAYKRVQSYERTLDLAGLKFLIKLPDNIPNNLDANLNCAGCGLMSLNGAPDKVEGYFNCSDNPNLTSLKGAPSSVGRDFNCSGNPNLTSLEGAPSSVGEDFYCSHNNLTSLEGAPSSVGGDFDCSYNNLTSLVGAPSSVGGGFNCRENNLTSLVGAPSSVGGIFNCSYNNLTSLVGAPSSSKSFICYNNNLTSLKGAPISVGGNFYCNANNLTSLEGIPAHIGRDLSFEHQKNGKEFTEEEIQAAMADSKRKQANSMLKENRKFTQLELLENLRDWFAPQVDKKGKKFRGWVNCKTGGPCGRSDTSKGSYPACRATKAECNKIKGRMYKKKGPKRVSWEKRKKKSS